MTDFSILIAIATALTGVFGYFFKRLVADLDALHSAFDEEKAHNAAEIAKIHDGYVKYEEFARLQSSIDQKLTRIYELLVAH
ncbi:MAG: hypothetical protein PHS97_03965 [Oscillospiraceae bacterium]|nr:hypothetical protein [Oscillospiraceae bacterium]